MTEMWDGCPTITPGNAHVSDLCCAAAEDASIIWWLGSWTCAIHGKTARGKQAYVTQPPDDGNAVIEPHTLRWARLTFMAQARAGDPLAVQVLDAIKAHNFAHYIQLVEVARKAKEGQTCG